jgi:hypothetical protein
LLWGKEKSIITVRPREIYIAVRHESPSGGMKLILAVRQRKIDYRREAKRNRLSPWGEEKIDYRQEAKKKPIIAVRRESPSGRMKSILAVRQRKIDYRREAKKKLISLRGGANEINYRHEAQPEVQIKCHREGRLWSPWGMAARPKKISPWRGRGCKAKGILHKGRSAHKSWNTASKQQSTGFESGKWQPRALTEDNVLNNASQHANWLPRRA